MASEIIIAPSIGKATPEVESLALHGAVVLRNMNGEVSKLVGSLNILSDANDIRKVTVVTPATAYYGNPNTSGYSYLNEQLAAVRGIMGEDLHFQALGKLVRIDNKYTASIAQHRTLVLTTPTTMPYSTLIEVLNRARQEGDRLVDTLGTDFLHAFHPEEFIADAVALLKPRSSGGIGITDVRIVATTEAENGLINRRAERVQDALAGIAKVETRAAEPVDLALLRRGSRQLVNSTCHSGEGVVRITKVPVTNRYRLK